MVTDSVVVFVVRKGNPKHITVWSDLVKPGVQVVTPNPFSSGSARWNLAAAYGAELKLGKTPAQAQGLPEPAAPEHGRRSRRAPAPRWPTFVVGDRRRPPRLRGRRDRGHEQGRADPVRGPEADHPDREPDRRDHPRREPDRRPRRSSTSSCRRRARSCGRSRATARCCPAQRRRRASPSRRPPQLFTIASLGGWTKVVTRPSSTRPPGS